MNYGVASWYGDNGEAGALKSIVKNFPRNEWVIFDVGANQGTYTRTVMNVLAGTPYRLHAFEPSPAAFEKLKTSVESSPNLFLWKLGFSETQGETKLYADEAASTLASIYPRDLTHAGRSFTHHDTISVDTMDRFCAEHALTRIDVLKLDVEGHEWSVLKGASSMLQNDSIRFIQFEFGGSNIDGRTYFKDFYFLLNPKYRLYRIVKDGLYELERYDERLEIFQSANFLAIHRNEKEINKFSC